MVTRLSTDIVYRFVKNFYYDPVYDVVGVTITADTELATLPIQFTSDIKYTPGAYVVKDGVLYIAIAVSSGPWASDSISNVFANDNVFSGEHFTADVETGDYDPTKFTPVSPLEEGETLTLYELMNPRTQKVKIAFDTVAHARDYLREYTESSDYAIHVEKISSNTYRATWDGNTMIFYD